MKRVDNFRNAYEEIGWDFVVDSRGKGGETIKGDSGVAGSSS